MHLSSDATTGALTCRLLPPTAVVGDDGLFRPTGYMERVSKALEQSTVAVSRSWIEREVKGRSDHIRAAIDALHAEGYIAIERQGQALLHSLMKPYLAPSEREEDF